MDLSTWRNALIAIAIVVAFVILRRLFARPLDPEIARLPKPTRKTLDEAARRLRRGDAAGASELVAPLAGEDCGSAPILMFHGMVLSAAGQRDLALRQLERAYALDPQKLSLTFLLYSSYRDRGQPERAEQVIRSTLSHPQMNACVAQALAVGFGERGLHEAELICWECAARLDPSESAFVNNRLSTLSRLGRYEEQLSGLEEAATRFPDSYLLSANRVHALLHLGRMDEAAARGREVMQKWPDQAGVINNLSWFFLLDGAGERVDQAEALLARTEKLKVSKQVAHPLRGTKLLLRLRRGRHAEGLNEVRALIKEELSGWGPRFPKLIPAPARRHHGNHRLMESMFLEALGRTQEARTALHDGLKYDPDPAVIELARSLSNTARA